MADYRLAFAAQKDIQRILTESRRTWGDEAGRRYSSLLEEALSRVAADPEGRSTRDRSDLFPGARSFHLRNVRHKRGVKNPVHILVYRVADAGIVEIARVLHERMDPSRHML